MFYYLSMVTNRKVYKRVFCVDFMITMQPQDIEGTYLRLLSPRQEADEPDRFTQWVDDQDSRDNLIARIGKRSLESRPFDGGNIPLLSPLERCRLYLYSDGQDYRAALELHSQTESHKETKKLIEKSKKRFLKDCEQECVVVDKGIFVMLDEDPYFLLDYSPCTKNHVIGFGNAGTLKRKLSGLSQFETDFNRYCEVASLAVNSFYDRGKEPNLNLYLYL